MSWFVVLLALVFFCAFSIYLRVRMRRTGYVDWERTRWTTLPRERRRRIQRAVFRGEALTDPRDAELAVELIDNRRRLAPENSRPSFGPRHFLPILLVGGVLLMQGGDPLNLLFFLVPLVYLGGGYLFLRNLEARSGSAREKNERVRDSLL